MTFRRTAGLVLAAALLAACALASLAVGAAMLPLDVVWAALTANDGSASHVTVSEARVGRTLLGITVGAALGVSGALIQALTRNPLADPGILGVNAGAGFAVALAVAFFGVTRISEYLPFAFLGAIAATVAVYLVAGGVRGTPTPVRLTLVGVALGAVLMGISRTLALLNAETFDRMRFWSAGTIADRPPGTLEAILPFILVGLVLAALCATPLNAVALGDDLARTVGARLGWARAGVVLSVTLLCGAATAASGVIAFVGLMMPHSVRWITGPDWRWILAYSALLAPALVLASDVVGRLVLMPAELQVSIVTALLGAPMLILLVRRTRATAL
ncbi:iron chelate uptake ABC transporter family permease subunit [Citricoccus parietis]|uniref:Iron chelate uptake ABC transporter family permease subunit n=2 Tax=Citricoccus parietis TaxID=592307 RepID=A0ABV6F2Z8_9MICC